MEFNVEQRNDTTCIKIVGSIDALTADDVSKVLEGQVQEGRTCLVVDMSAVDYVSSVGLRVILTVLKDLRRSKGDLRLAAAQPGVSRMLHMSGFTSILKSFDTVDEAVTSFGS